MDQERFRKGIETREAVLGREYVERSQRETDDFVRPFRELVTEYCWGSVWARPGLPLSTRSMLNIAMLVALNRERELKIHIRGALRNGVTHDEIQEVLLQATAYCGIPAGAEAFRAAREVFAEPDTM